MKNRHNLPDNEEWRDVVGYEGFYMVSNKGRVKSLDRYIDFISRWGTLAKRFYKGKFLKPQWNIHGYSTVLLHKTNIKRKTLTIHKLVMEAFTGLITDSWKRQVNHIDGNKKNNNLSNLEWCSVSENQKHNYDVLGLISSCRKRVRGTCLKTGVSKEYDCIKDTEKDGFCRTKVSSVCTGQRDHHKNYLWEHIIE